MRAFIATIAALGLAACAPAVPKSGLGVGFQDYNTYMTNRQAAMAQPMSAGSGNLAPVPGGTTSLTGVAAIDGTSQGRIAQNPLAPRSLQEQAALLGGGQAAPAPQSPSPLAPATNTGRVIGQGTPVISAEELAAVRPRGNAPAGIVQTTSEMNAVGGVSDEQDFDAVAARESIESDRARIERNRAQYQIDQPGALPQRAGVGPSVVEYALATQHPLGAKKFQRSPIRLKNLQASCSPYANDDLAQEAFLAAGGPNRDRLGLDPDGDGYACGWDPAPYRAVVP